VPSIAYGSSAYRRTNGNFPELRLSNMFVEKAATSENQAAIISRPGLQVSMTNGSGPIRALFSQAGTFNSDVFSLSGSTLYRKTTSLGTVSGSGFASVAGGYNELLVACGDKLKSYNGTNFVDAGFVGNSSNNVIATCFINSTFVAVEANSARYFWSAPLNGRSWDVLNFATAEREPDNLLDVAPLQNNLWCFGERSVEVHADNGGNDARFTPIETLGYDKGILATGCVCRADNALFFAGSDYAVYRVGEAPQRVSEHWIEAKIQGSATCKVFSYRYEGHEFVAIRLDDGTLQYDCATQEWDENSWPIQCAVEGYFGHDSSGVVASFGGWDDLGSALERRFTAALTLEEPQSIDRLSLWANTGHTELMVGQGSDPIIEMRYSRDAGQTWSNFIPASLGKIGRYRVRAIWRRLGEFDPPGAMFDFRLTDPVSLRISDVKVNDVGGSRSR
jgi:hypothetical protein